MKMLIKIAMLLVMSNLAIAQVPAHKSDTIVWEGVKYVDSCQHIWDGRIQAPDDTTVYQWLDSLPPVAYPIPGLEDTAALAHSEFRGVYIPKDTVPEFEWKVPIYFYNLPEERLVIPEARLAALEQKIDNLYRMIGELYELLAVLEYHNSQPVRLKPAKK